MNKFLAILWSIILLGSVYIAVNLFKPDSALEQQIIYEELNEENAISRAIAEEEEEDTTFEIIEDQEEEEFEDKNYAQYLSDGDGYFEQENYTNAIESYGIAAGINPNSSKALNKLAASYLGNNQPEDAKKYYEMAFNLNSNSLEIQIGYLRSLINSRALTEAENLVINMDDSQPEVKYYKSIILTLKKEYSQVETLLAEINENESASVNTKEKANIILLAFETYNYYPEAESVFLDALICKALSQVGENESAIILGLDIIDRKENYRDAWIVLGYAYLATDDARSAIDALSQAESLESEKPETLFYLGLAYFSNNDIDQAISYLEKAYKNGYEPKDQINLKLGDLYLLKENYNKAAFRYEKILTKNTKNMDIFVKAIWLNIDKTNDPEKALSLAKKVVENHPQDPMSFNLLGWAQLANGDLQNAEANLQTSLNINPSLDATNLNYGLLYEKKGDVFLAKEFYKKAYLLGRGNAIARRAATSYNKLTENELTEYYQIEVSTP
jgi:tetratricopeptide (TPR) repeat protein